MASKMQIKTFSSANEAKIPINELKPKHTTKMVHVKVLHSWKQNVQPGGETLEFILADEKGHKIQATCKKTYMESKGSDLLVGVWRNIRNFHVRPAGGAFRTTNHTYKIVFNQNTVVSRSSFMNDDLYLNLVDFQTILSGTLNEKFLIDVMGQVLDCGDVNTIMCTGGIQKRKLEFILRDIKLSTIYTATLYPITGELQISNSFDASQMIINPTIPEAEAFKDMDNGDDTTMITFESNQESQEDNNKQLANQIKRGQRDKWWQEPTKSIHEMITSTQVGKCLVTCTVYAIDMDWSWYYFGCEACQKRVIKTGTMIKKTNGNTITTHIWWCETCDDNVFKVSPRFWLHLMVQDDTGVSKIMILDKVANGIVAESPLKLLNGSWDEDLNGKSFTFGVYVEKDNVLYGAEIFKVGKVYKERMNFLLVQSHPGSVDLTYSQDLNDSVSTPSSKRKEDETNSVPDISSTSKKPCLMTVKVEKAEEAAKTRG
ncbi:hypothetical protein Bca4012_063936 [Brassica carinata]